MIAVLAHIGNRNLGDEAIVAAVIQGVRARRSDAPPLVLSIDPGDTSTRHQVASLALRRTTPPWNPTAGAPSRSKRDRLSEIRAQIGSMPVIGTVSRRVLATARSAVALGREVDFLLTSAAHVPRMELMLVAGSAQLFDYFGGPWGFPYTLFKWVLLCRARGCPVAFLSMGAGPIQAPLSRAFLAAALRLASYRSYRDLASRELAASMGLPRTDPVVPDLAFSLSPLLPAPCSQPGTVAINAMPYFATHYWPETNLRIYQQYLDALARFAAHLIDRGFDLLLFPTQLNADPPVLHELYSAIRTYRSPAVSRIVIASVADLPDLLRQLAHVQFVVATRFHAIVFACMLQKPLLAIAYHPKTQQLMRDLGLEDFVEPADNPSAPSLLTRFGRLEACAAAVRTSLQSRLSAYRDSLDRQYDTVLTLSRPRRAA